MLIRQGIKIKILSEPNRSGVKEKILFFFEIQIIPQIKRYISQRIFMVMRDFVPEIL